MQDPEFNLTFHQWTFVNQSMYTEVEVANQWHCRTHNNLCPTLQKIICDFVCDQACEQLT